MSMRSEIKKLLVVALCASLFTCFAVGCGGSKDNKDSSKASTTSSAVSKDESKTESKAEESSKTESKAEESSKTESKAEESSKTEESKAEESSKTEESKAEDNAEGAVIKFKKPDSWGDGIKAYVYLSDADKNANWPGEAMTDNGDGTYSYNVDKHFMEGTDPKVVFNDGKNQAPKSGGFIVKDGQEYDENYSD